MALSVTLGTLVTRCKQRSDQEGTDGHIGDANNEWKSLVSEVYGELHGAVSDAGARYFETEATITATGDASYALPASHLSTIGIDYVVDTAGRRRDLAELMVQEQVHFAGETGEAYLFTLSGSNIVFYPKPSSGTYKHLYIPQPTDYSTAADATGVDCINNDGMAFIIWGVASIALHKGEANQQRAMLERDAAKERLVMWAINRAMTMPKRRVVTDWDQAQRFDPADWRWSR